MGVEPAQNEPLNLPVSHTRIESEESESEKAIPPLLKNSVGRDSEEKDPFIKQPFIKEPFIETPKMEIQSKLPEETQEKKEELATSWEANSGDRVIYLPSWRT